MNKTFIMRQSVIKAGSSDSAVIQGLCGEKSACEDY